jgi:N-acetylglucosaminyldiphosphoundecaprenol N-acetyl-beta-D-mannosaminyltransferase
MSQKLQKNTKKVDNRGKIWSPNLFGGSKAQLLNELDVHLKTSTELKVISTPNPEQYVQASENPDFLTALQASDLLLPDGWGLVWAYWLLSQRGHVPALAERIPGREVVTALLSMASRRGMYVLVIGGWGYADKQYQVWQVEEVGNKDTHGSPDSHKLPLWWTPGFKDVKQPQQSEHAALATLLETYQPDIVFVALGAPDQEMWVHTHRELLEKNGVKLAMSVGGSFDTILGLLPEPPALVAKLKLEWLFRLVLQPWRWKRQLRLLRFVGLVVQEFFAPSGR